MPHLSIDFSAELENSLDMTGFCAAMRDALVETGVFPLAGIRVRAHRADHAAIADGVEPYGYLDMILRMGQGRPEAARAEAAEAIYAAAERFLAANCTGLPVMLSLEVQEIVSQFSIKRHNTVRPRIAARAAG